MNVLLVELPKIYGDYAAPEGPAVERARQAYERTVGAVVQQAESQPWDRVVLCVDDPTVSYRRALSARYARERDAKRWPDEVAVAYDEALCALVGRGYEVARPRVYAPGEVIALGTDAHMLAGQTGEARDVIATIAREWAHAFVGAGKLRIMSSRWSLGALLAEGIQFCRPLYTNTGAVAGWKNFTAALLVNDGQAKLPVPPQVLADWQALTTFPGIGKPFATLAVRVPLPDGTSAWRTAVEAHSAATGAAEGMPSGLRKALREAGEAAIRAEVEVARLRTDAIDVAAWMRGEEKSDAHEGTDRGHDAIGGAPVRTDPGADRRAASQPAERARGDRQAETQGARRSQDPTADARPRLTPKDENDAHRAGSLPADPAEGTGPAPILPRRPTVAQLEAALPGQHAAALAADNLAAALRAPAPPSPPRAAQAPATPTVADRDVKPANQEKPMSEKPYVFAATPATRGRILLRAALCGPGGSGKTYSALAIAAALVARLKCKPLYVIDSENGSSLRYARSEKTGRGFEFFHVPMPTDDYSPAAYMAAIDFCEQQGAGVVLIDSVSHEYDGPGGILEIVDNAAEAAAKRGGGRDNFSGWKIATPQHKRFLQRVCSIGAHVICTLRAKTAYESRKDERGKTKFEKVGLGPIQREGFEYEMDLFGWMDDATLTIDKTRSDRIAPLSVWPKPGADVAELLAEWVEDSGAPDPLALRIDEAVATSTDAATYTVAREALISWMHAHDVPQARGEGALRELKNRAAQLQRRGAA